MGIDQQGGTDKKRARGDAIPTAKSFDIENLSNQPTRPLEIVKVNNRIETTQRENNTRSKLRGTSHCRAHTLYTH
jgi:hypothetical protein